MGGVEAMGDVREAVGWTEWDEGSSGGEGRSGGWKDG